MNMNKTEMNDNMMEQVNGGYIWEPTGWAEGDPEKHLRYDNFDVEVEENWFSPNVYKIHGTEVSEDSAYQYARSVYHKLLDQLAKKSNR